MFIKNSIIVLYFSTVLVPAHSTKITVDHFKTILSPIEFEQLQKIHRPSKLNAQYKRRCEVIRDPEEDAVTLDRWQSYKKPRTEEGVTKLNSCDHRYSPVICVFGKDGIIHYAASIYNEYSEIVNKKSSSLNMAKTIKDDAPVCYRYDYRLLDTTIDQASTSYNRIQHISHNIIMINKLLDAAKDVHQIMSTDLNTTLLLILEGEQHQHLIEESIESTQYPEDRVKTILYPCGDKEVDFSLDFNPKNTPTTRTCVARSKELSSSSNPYTSKEKLTF